jgi:hypothetical protein
MMFFLVLLLGIAGVGAFIWNYRRQAAAREAASAERMKAFLEQARAQVATREPATLSTVSGAPAAQNPLRTAPPLVSQLTGFVLRAPLLQGQQAVLFDLLKTALPEHAIFACVSLAAFIRPADTAVGFAREAQERRLTDAVLDFVVCDRLLNPLAAVHGAARSGKPAEAAAFAAACVVSHGLRWVDLSLQALPDAAEIRQRVLGP